MRNKNRYDNSTHNESYSYDNRQWHTTITNNNHRESNILAPIILGGFAIVTMPVWLPVWGVVAGVRAINRQINEIREIRRQRLEIERQKLAIEVRKLDMLERSGLMQKQELNPKLLTSPVQMEVHKPKSQAPIFEYPVEYITLSNDKKGR